MCKLSKDLGVRCIRFSKKAKHISGSYDMDASTIFVSGKQNKKEMLYTFFHELAHHLIPKSKRSYLYHENAATPLISSQCKFKIENKVDQLARKLWFKYVDVKEWGRYKYGYLKTQKHKYIAWFETLY